MCKIMKVEPTGEYKKMFALFDQDDSGRIDMREFMLGLSNFSGEDRKSKTEFAFKLYDEDGNGFITEDELINILKANHMAKTKEEVARKAKTIMTQCDKDGDGKIDREEFEIVAQKFPNLLFPAHKMHQKLLNAGKVAAN